MNNRFKFRVWDKSRNVWIPDHSVCIFNGHAYELEVGGTEYLANGSSYNPLRFVENDCGSPFHNPNLIIQQYTGFKDKNGKEVYEGDIVNVQRWHLRPFVNEKNQIDYKSNEGDLEAGVIIWGWNFQKFLVDYSYTRYDDSEDFDTSSHRVEVIGNIFEPPCNPDFNGECLVCDCWPIDCAFKQYTQ